jgi:hypothetical protein
MALSGGNRMLHTLFDQTNTAYDGESFLLESNRYFLNPNFNELFIFKHPINNAWYLHCWHQPGALVICDIAIPFEFVTCGGLLGLFTPQKEITPLNYDGMKLDDVYTPESCAVLNRLTPKIWLGM